MAASIKKWRKLECHKEFKSTLVKMFPLVRCLRTAVSGVKYPLLRGRQGGGEL